VNGDSIVLRGHTAPVRCVDFSFHTNSSTQEARESLLITCSDDKTVKIWTLPQKSFRCSLIGHKNWVRSCKFSPDTPHICASGGDDATIKLWDVNRGENIVTYTLYRGDHESVTGHVSADSVTGVKNIAFHPMGTTLAANASDGNLRLYDLRSDRVICTLRPTSANKTSKSSSSGFVGGLDFHPSGNFLLSSSHHESDRDHNFNLWDIRKQSSIFSIRHGSVDSRSKLAASSLTSCCSFSANGSRFATGSSNKVVLLWDMSPKINAGESEASKVDSLNGDKGKKKCVRAISNRGKKQPSTIQDVIPEREYILESVINEDPPPFICPFPNLTKNVANLGKGAKTNEISAVLVCTLDHVVGQLNLITQTLSLIEKRLSLQEDTIATLKTEHTAMKEEIKRIKMDGQTNQ